MEEEKKNNDWRQTGPAAAFNSPLRLRLKCSFAYWKCYFIAAKILPKDMILGAQQGNVLQSRQLQSPPQEEGLRASDGSGCPRDSQAYCPGWWELSSLGRWRVDGLGLLCDVPCSGCLVYRVREWDHAWSPSYPPCFTPCHASPGGQLSSISPGHQWGHLSSFNRLPSPGTSPSPFNIPEALALFPCCPAHMHQKWIVYVSACHHHEPV